MKKKGKRAREGIGEEGGGGKQKRGMIGGGKKGDGGASEGPESESPG